MLYKDMDFDSFFGNGKLSSMKQASKSVSMWQTKQHSLTTKNQAVNYVATIRS
jgi:hypothetical protein